MLIGRTASATGRDDGSSQIECAAAEEKIDDQCEQAARERCDAEQFERWFRQRVQRDERREEERVEPVAGWCSPGKWFAVQKHLALHAVPGFVAVDAGKVAELPAAEEHRDADDREALRPQTQPPRAGSETSHATRRGIVYWRTGRWCVERGSVGHRRRPVQKVANKANKRRIQS